MKILILILSSYFYMDCPVEKELYRNFTGIKRLDNFLYREQRSFWKQKQRREKKNEKTKHALPSNNGNNNRMCRIDEL